MSVRNDVKSIQLLLRCQSGSGGQTNNRWQPPKTGLAKKKAPKQIQLVLRNWLFLTPTIFNSYLKLDECYRFNCFLSHLKAFWVHISSGKHVGNQRSNEKTTYAHKNTCNVAYKGPKPVYTHFVWPQGQVILSIYHSKGHVRPPAFTGFTSSCLTGES